MNFECLRTYDTRIEASLEYVVEFFYSFDDSVKKRQISSTAGGEKKEVCFLH